MSMIIRHIFIVGLPMVVFGLKQGEGLNPRNIAWDAYFNIEKMMGITQPRNKPYPELLEHEYALPEGSGCGKRPLFPLTSVTTPATKYIAPGSGSDPGWNGFCEMGWSLCPDAAANHDYSYYWRGLGPKWVEYASGPDSQYCLNNGWLKPEVARLVRNFTALKAKGEELCREQFAPTPENHYDELGIMGINMVMDLASKNREAAKLRGDRGYSAMDAEAASMSAAWNCALGDVSCDIAYCNYAYCEKPDGSAGIMSECEGFDPVRGMPAMYS